MTDPEDIIEDIVEEVIRVMLWMTIIGIISFDLLYILFSYLNLL